MLGDAIFISQKAAVYCHIAVVFTESLQTWLKNWEIESVQEGQFYATFEATARW